MRKLWQLGALEIAGKIRSGKVSSREVIEAHLARADAVADHPVLLSPTCTHPAFEHGADLTDTDRVLRKTLRPVVPGNLLGLPGAIVPCGPADGLPVSIQVIGDRFTDLRCLAIAEQIETAVGAPAPIDPITA